MLASENSWNSPVTTKAVCSPMSTALSPMRSMQRATTNHAHPPLLVLRRARVRPAPVCDDPTVRPVDQLVEVDERAGRRSTSRSANESSAIRTISSARSPISLGAPRASVVLPLEARGDSFVSFATVDRLVADALEVHRVGWRIASTSLRSVCDRRLLREHLLDLTSEGGGSGWSISSSKRITSSAEFDVPRLERVHRAADRSGGRPSPRPQGSPRGCRGARLEQRSGPAQPNRR